MNLVRKFEQAEVVDKEDRVVIIDGDSLVFQCSQPGKDENGEKLPEYTGEEYIIAEGKLSERILGILNSIELKYNITEWYLCIKGKGNFRYGLYPEYKAKRPKAADIIPHLYSYLDEAFNPLKADGYEADDLVYTLSERIGHKGVIAGIDKDLKQIPSEFYNYNTGEFFVVDEDTARWNLAMQLICGDVGDGVNFLRGIGPKKAQKFIWWGMTERELIRGCLSAYESIWGDQAKEMLRLCYKLLKLHKMTI